MIWFNIGFGYWNISHSRPYSKMNGCKVTRAHRKKLATTIPSDWERNQPQLVNFNVQCSAGKFRNTQEPLRDIQLCLIHMMCSWNVAHVCKCDRQANCRYETQNDYGTKCACLSHVRQFRARSLHSRCENGREWKTLISLRSSSFLYPFLCDCIELFTQNLCIFHVDISGFICLLPPFKYIQLAPLHSALVLVLPRISIVQLLMQNKCHDTLFKLADWNELSTCALISSSILLDHSQVIKLWAQSCCNSLLFHLHHQHLSS